MIRISELTKSFNSSLIFDKLDFSISAKTFVTIVGPSGCGKTTLLNIISGIYLPDSGKIKITEGKRIGYMLQDSSLLPWRTLRENTLLSIEILKHSHIAYGDKIKKYFNSFELSGYEDYYPEALSGGMKQRAALIRTLLFSPDILLLDEPFSNLDYDIKLKVQKILIEYFYQHNCTIILVTHDIEDAIALSDNIFILSEKPTTIKKEINIELGLKDKNPVEARLSPHYGSYFKEIWEELKYLD